MGKLSKSEYRQAKAAVYAAKGQGPCPYPEGSRIAGHWERAMRHYHSMECLMDEMAEVYGEFRPDRLKAAT